jgi:hypothetical protein
MVAGKLANMPNHRPESKDANLHTSKDEAAKLLNVSPRSVATAKKVQEKAVPELSEKCNLSAAFSNFFHRTNPRGETLDFTGQNNSFRTNHPTKSKCNLLQ